MARDFCGDGALLPAGGVRGCRDRWRRRLSDRKIGLGGAPLLLSPDLDPKENDADAFVRVVDADETAAALYAFSQQKRLRRG